MLSAKVPRPEIHSVDFIATFIPCESILKPFSSFTMTATVTSRLRNFVAHTSNTHKPHSHSNNCHNYNLYINLPHERNLEGRTSGFVRIHCCCQSRRDACVDLRDDRWKSSSSNVTGKVDKVVHDGNARSRATRCASPFCAHFEFSMMLITADVSTRREHYHKQRPRSRRGPSCCCSERHLSVHEPEDVCER